VICYTQQTVNSRPSKVRNNGKEDLRQKICKLADTCIAHEDVESSELLDGFCHELLSGLWFPDVSRHPDDLAAGIAGFSD